MLNETNLHNYQNRSTEHILNNPSCGLFLDMGLGKTISSLTAIDKLMFDRFEIKKVLVIAPKRVARDTWMDEVKSWSHIGHLKLSICVGSSQQRKAALQAKADVYTINRENVVWLTALYGSKCPFDMIIIDESSSFKSPSAQRFKALKKWTGQCKRVVLLTGTPAPNGYEDLWAQMYLLDGGERLGKFVTNFRDRFFTIDPSTAYSTYPKRVLKEGAKEQIHGLISDICISMKAEDYLELPKVISRDIKVHLTDKEMQDYKDFEKSLVLELPEGEITAMNAGVLRNKLIQYTSGAVYGANREAFTVSDAKIEAVEEILDVYEEPVIIFYWYKHTYERLFEKFKKYKPRRLDTYQDQLDWNAGKIRVLLAQPAGMGHGVNIQKGGHFEIWFGYPESLEAYQQACKRLDRQGQQHAVIRNSLIAVGTIEEVLMQNLLDKADEQDGLMLATKYLEGLKNEYKKPNSI